MAPKQLATVTHYFDKIGVAVLNLKVKLKVGDVIHIQGHSTDFTQTVESMQVEHKSVEQAKPGDDVAMKVAQKVHPNDKVFAADS